MSRHTLIQVSDLHLSALRAYNYRGWAACRKHINRVHPDLVVATGDLVLCDPDHVADHDFVAAELARLDVPWAALPGNHDIGDTGPKPYMDQWVSQERRQRYLDRLGPDWWARDLGHWRIIGLNAQLPGSGLAAEVQQFAWLDAELAATAGRPIALFLHKPLFVTAPDEPGDPVWCLLEPARRALMDRFAGADLRLVGCGHAHHYRTLVAGNITMVWAPSTGLVIDDEVAPFDGRHEPGLVHYVFDGDRVEFGLVQPAGHVTSDLTDLVARHGAMRQAPILQLADVLD
ncbi:metallophosphoesterase [Dongia sp.]|uniref:metallophosphoesterase family protein n=1 Tax=Dongia sp. TaxID=1977262 RepID=UPI0035B431B3